MSVVFRDPRSGDSIELSDAVLEMLSRFKQRGWRQVERGGLLFANPRYKDRAVIDAASEPHHLDQATRTSLSLDHGRCQAEIDCANRGGRWFIGYWHTHPERFPKISGDDIHSFRRNLNAGGHELSTMLAVIVGTAPGRRAISAYLVAEAAITSLPTE